jgi:hypothetical protein
MPVDEERWPGPDEHREREVEIAIMAAGKAFYDAYGVALRIGKSNAMRAMEETIHEVNRVFSAEEKTLENTSHVNLCDNWSIRELRIPSHIGPRSSNTFGRNGKKKF